MPMTDVELLMQYIGFLSVTPPQKNSHLGDPLAWIIKIPFCPVFAPLSSFWTILLSSDVSERWLEKKETKDLGTFCSVSHSGGRRKNRLQGGI